MSINYAKKILMIRKSEDLTQAKFSAITGIGLSTIKNYETGQSIAGAAIMERVVNTDEFKKYALWLLLDQTSPESGQIAPKIIETESDIGSKRIS